MAMSAWQWFVGVVGRLRLSHETTPCCRQVYVTDAWVDAGGRDPGGGGDLSFGTDELVIFAGPDGAENADRVPYDDLGGLKVVVAATSSGSSSSMSSDSEKCG